jgi:hypothetical protein
MHVIPMCVQKPPCIRYQSLIQSNFTVHFRTTLCTRLQTFQHASSVTRTYCLHYSVTIRVAMRVNVVAVSIYQSS